MSQIKGGQSHMGFLWLQIEGKGGNLIWEIRVISVISSCVLAFVYSFCTKSMQFLDSFRM